MTIYFQIGVQTTTVTTFSGDFKFTVSLWRIRSTGCVVTQLHASYTSVRLNLMVGIVGEVPDTKDDIRLGDVVSKLTAGWPGVVSMT